MADAPFSGPYTSMKYSAALRKMHRLPQAKGIPARTGESQWVEGLAVQANQKRLFFLLVGFWGGGGFFF